MPLSGGIWPVQGAFACLAPLTSWAMAFGESKGRWRVKLRAHWFITHRRSYNVKNALAAATCVGRVPVSYQPGTERIYCRSKHRDNVL
jgi:hypothetical protein